MTRATDLIYGNYKVLSPENQVMFRCNKKRYNWYLQRGLAEEIGDKTIRLTFTPNGGGYAKNSFYTQDRENRCVICGTRESLTRHHVVPHCYRKHFPEDLKRNNFHDILPVCLDCHEEYESNYSLQMRKRLEKKYDAPLQGRGYTEADDDYLHAIRLAGCLIDYGDRIPEKRQEEMREIIRGATGKEVDEPLLIELANDKVKKLSRSEHFCSHGELVMDQVEDIQSFVEEWRLDFLENMEPKYLPKGWKVDMPVDHHLV